MSDEKKNDGGPAYPSEYDLQVPYPHSPSELYWTKMKAPGMSLRDHFAGLAMQAVWSQSDDSIHDSSLEDFEVWQRAIMDDVAKGAYAMADAMIKAREQ